MKTLQQMRAKANYIAANIEQEATKYLIEKYKRLCAEYWKTGNGAGEINALYHELESRGVNSGYLDQLDDDIYESIFYKGAKL